MRRKYFLFIWVYIALLLISELLINYGKYVHAFIFTTLWVLIYVLILIKMKFDMKVDSNYSLLHMFYEYKKFLTVIIAVPVLMLIMLSFPFKGIYLYDLIIVYSIFGAMTGVYLMNFRVHFLRIGHHFGGIRWLLPGLILTALIAVINNKFLSSQTFEFDIFSLFFVVFSSYITVVYFYGLLQNFLRGFANNFVAILYPAFVLSILEIPLGVLTVITTFLSALLVSFIFFKSRNIILAFLLQSLLILMQYILFPQYKLF